MCLQTENIVYLNVLVPRMKLFVSSLIERLKYWIICEDDNNQEPYIHA